MTMNAEKRCGGGGGNHLAKKYKLQLPICDQSIGSEPKFTRIPRSEFNKNQTNLEQNYPFLKWS